MAAVVFSAAAVASRLAAPHPPPAAFSFSVGGMLFSYQLGVGAELVRAGCIVPGVTQLSGASAGSLVAAVLALGMDAEEALDVLARVRADCLDAGRTAGRLGDVLRREMLPALPEDAAERLAGGTLAVPYFRLLPRPGPVVCRSFSSREDLFDVLMASCNWPFFLRRWPLVTCRGALALDGYFVAPTTLGALYPGELGSEEAAPQGRTVVVSAFPSSAVGRLRAAVAEEDLICPAIGGDPPDMAAWLTSALNAEDDARTRHLFDLGVGHARAWLQRQRTLAAPWGG